MPPLEYATKRRQLLQLAGWHGYVARRGLNAADGAAARRTNQRQLAELRRDRRAGKAVA